MTENFSDLNITRNNNPNPIQEPMQDYNTYTEIMENIRHTQIGNLAVLAALSTATLYALIQYKTDKEDSILRIAALVQFVLTEVFILGVFRFLIT